MDNLGAGFLISRELVGTPWSDVELGISAFVMAEIQSYYEDEDERTFSAADLRVGAFARVLVGHAPLRWTLALDVDLSPLRLRRDLVLDPLLPKLPSWSVGLGLGAAWSEL
jgi:hypothetical protein